MYRQGKDGLEGALKLTQVPGGPCKTGRWGNPNQHGAGSPYPGRGSCAFGTGAGAGWAVSARDGAGWAALARDRAGAGAAGGKGAALHLPGTPPHPAPALCRSGGQGRSTGSGTLRVFRIMYSFGGLWAEGEGPLSPWVLATTLQNIW